MLSIHRRVLNEKLSEQFQRLKPGVVLDVGAAKSPYRDLIPATRYLVLEKHAEFKPDICCDVHDIQAQDESFDTVIATELLEHTEDPQKVVSEFRRVLKKKGVCIVSVPFLYPVHSDRFMKDYWRFTGDGLRELFKGFSQVEVHPFGSSSTALLSILFNGFPFLNRLSALFYKVRFGTMVQGFVVFAVK